MAYFAPYIDSTGLHIPTQPDIFAYLLAQYQAVYGSLTTTDNSDPDIQWITNLSLMINDAFGAIQLVYNARSPLTAVGSDLDGICAISGIARIQGSYSVATLLIQGVPGTTIVTGLVSDSGGNIWQLPNNIIIPNTGNISVQASCQTIGPISALTGTIINIVNPQYGWTSATNPSEATPGTGVETDSALRARQALSVALNAKTLVQATLATIAAVPGVTRLYTGPAVENPTGAVDSYGNPAHSISMVVEGGLNIDVATAIYDNKTPGCFTNGTTSVNVVDPNSGATMTINFSRPAYVPIYVTMNVHGLPVLTTSMQLSIQTAVLNYINGLQIGENVTVSGLIASAMATMPNIKLPTFSIQSTYAGTSASPSTSTDIALTYNQCAQAALSNIVINSV
jgi:uncharacterized phage protein gp47/JayE